MKRPKFVSVTAYNGLLRAFLRLGQHATELERSNAQLRRENTQLLERVLLHGNRTGLAVPAVVHTPLPDPTGTELEEVDL